MKRHIRLAAFLGTLCGLASSGPAMAQSTTLRVSSFLPPSHVLVSDVLLPWCKDIEAGTQGKVKCNLLPKPVVGALQTIDGVVDGLTDISYTVHGYHPGRFPLTKAAEFPFMADSSEVMSVAWHRVYTKMLAQANEHRGVLNLAMYTHGPGNLYTTNKPINAIQDIQGLKIRVAGGVSNDVTVALGGVPMLRGAQEIYELLKSGIADGVVFPKGGVRLFKLEGLIKHALLVPGGLYNVSFNFMMNPDSFKRLGKAEQDVIMRLSGEPLARRTGKAWDLDDIRGVETMKSVGTRVQIAGEPLIKEIRARTESLEKEWIEKEAKPKGVDGAAVLAALRAEIRNVAAAR